MQVVPSIWPYPGIIPNVSSKVRIPNLSDDPHVLKRHEHFCQISPISTPINVESYTKHSKNIQLDPDNLLSPDMSIKFHDLLNQYDSLFDPNITGDKLVELQQKFDELERLGVFKRREDIDVSVEYINPSFLVKNANGSARLVTAFTDVAVATQTPTIINAGRGQNPSPNSSVGKHYRY